VAAANSRRRVIRKRAERPAFLSDAKLIPSKARISGYTDWMLPNSAWDRFRAAHAEIPRFARDKLTHR
jgi:hypothetical protein